MTRARRVTRIGRAAATLGLILPACLFGLPAAAVADPVPLPPGANASADYVVGPVSCLSAGSCVAAGAYTDTSGAGQGLLLTQSGGAWAAAQAPLPTGAAANPQVGLDGLACASSSDCVAAGDYLDDNGDYQGVLATGNDGSWSGITAPLPDDAATNPGVSLYSAACPPGGSCVAVGDYYYGSGSGHTGLLLTQSGGGWSATTSPLPNGAGADPEAGLESVSCPAAGQCVAVGYYFEDSNREGLLVTQDAGGWAAVKAPLPNGAGSAQLVTVESVSCQSAGSCVALGYYDDSSDYQQILILTLAGGEWSAAQAPLPAGAGAIDPSAVPASVSCASAGSCVGAGFYDDDNDVQQGLLLTEQSGTWTATAMPLPPGADTADPTGSASGVSCASATSCLAVGDYSDSMIHQQGVLLSWSAGGWTATLAALPAATATNPDASMGGVACAADGYCATSTAFKGSSGSRQGQLLTAPDAPTGVAAVAGTDQASVSWQAPADDGGYPLTGYAVTATDTTDAARGGQTATVGASTLGTTLTGLTPGDSYSFTVSATSLLGVGVGAVSNAVAVAAPRPTNKQILASLSKLLVPRGKHATLEAILRNGGYTFGYQALEAGRLMVRWYFGSTVERGRKHHRHRVKVRTLVASANVKVSKAGALKLKVELTRAGRKLLKAHKQLRLTAEVSFTPAGGRRLERTRAFTLKR